MLFYGGMRYARGAVCQMNECGASARRERGARYECCHAIYADAIDARRHDAMLFSPCRARRYCCFAARFFAAAPLMPRHVPLHSLILMPRDAARSRRHGALRARCHAMP